MTVSRTIKIHPASFSMKTAQSEIQFDGMLRSR